MNKKTNGEKLFILGIIFVLSMVVLCLTGCGGSCMGCSVGCQSNEGGCASGMGYSSDGCGSSNSCITTMNCVDFEEPYDDGSGNVLLMSCENTEEGCGGTSGCYNGIYCGGCSSCGSCGIFFGDIDGYDVDETNIGCIDGCVACGDTEGMWNFLLDRLYNVLDLK